MIYRSWGHVRLVQYVCVYVTSTRKGRQAADRRRKKKQRKETESNMAEAVLNTRLQVSRVWKYFTKTEFFLYKLHKRQRKYDGIYLFPP